MIDLFKENIIASFDKTPIIYPQDCYQIAFSHEDADFYEILNQFEYSRDITLLRQLSIYNLTKKEYITFFSSLTAIEIVFYPETYSSRTRHIPISSIYR